MLAQSDIDEIVLVIEVGRLETAIRLQVGCALFAMLFQNVGDPKSACVPDSALQVELFLEREDVDLGKQAREDVHPVVVDLGAGIGGHHQRGRDWGG